MKGRLKLLLTGLICFAGGLSIGFSQKGNCTPQVVVESSYSQKTELPTQQQLTEQQLRQFARSITVKVLSGDNGGSGILIGQQGEIYTVLTNQHVLLFGQGKGYRIQTPDGQIYVASLVNLPKFNQQDLGLLQFRTEKTYQVSSLSLKATPIPGEPVLSAGFPFETFNSKAPGFVVLDGKIQYIHPQTFGGGYQIGYTSTVKKGMSGGPLLNYQGQVIGINGIHKYPLWGNPYVFEDGHRASPEDKKWMSQLSWAITVQTFLRLAPQFAAREAYPVKQDHHW